MYLDQKLKDLISVDQKSLGQMSQSLFIWSTYMSLVLQLFLSPPSILLLMYVLSGLHIVILVYDLFYVE